MPFLTVLLAFGVAPCPAWAKSPAGGCPALLTPTTPASLSLVPGEAPAQSVTLAGKPVAVPSQHTLAPGVYELVARSGAGLVERRVVALRPGEQATVGVSVCGVGLVAAANGRCCRWGQTLDGGVCAGPFTCAAPATQLPDGGCALTPCTLGRTRTPEGGCCWAGQRFDVALDRTNGAPTRGPRCVGEPTHCPVGTVRAFDRCAPSIQFEDRDGDHVSDLKDKCPHEAEDWDGFQDGDGCPERDNDKDRVPDEQDLCPTVPEDADGFEDGDGCPDLDDDSDGVPDPVDRCRTEPEDADGVEDEDGCPEAR